MPPSRRLSIIFGLASVVVPIAWAYFQLSYNAAADGMRPGRGYASGLGSFVIVFFAALSSALLSGMGVICGLAAYRSRGKPRPVELLLIALPLVVSSGFLILLLLGD